MKSLFGLLVVLALAMPQKAAAEAAWWTQYKRQCSLEADLSYAEWQAMGKPCDLQATAQRDAERRARLKEKKAAEALVRKEEQKRIREQKKAEALERKEQRARERALAKEERRARRAEKDQMAEQKRLEEQKQLEEQARIEEQQRLEELARADEQRRLREEAQREEQRRLEEQARIERIRQLEEQALIEQQQRLDAPDPLDLPPAEAVSEQQELPETVVAMVETASPTRGERLFIGEEVPPEQIVIEPEPIRHEMTSELMDRLINYNQSLLGTGMVKANICRALGLCDGSIDMQLKLSMSQGNGAKRYFGVPLNFYNAYTWDIVLMVEYPTFTEAYLTNKAGVLRAAAISQDENVQLVSNDLAAESFASVMNWFAEQARGLPPAAGN